MAALGTDVSISLIATTLENASTNLGVLCRAIEVNKWSRYKPVRGTYPQSVDSNYGIDVSTLWSYLKPRGGTTEQYRIRDFVEYEHDQVNTMPPAYIRRDTSSFAQTEIYDKVFYPQITASLNVNTGASYEITLTDLGLSNYYFGIYITQPSHGQYWWKTLSSVATDAQSISAHLVSDFPTGISEDGSYTEIQFILSSEIKATWDNTQPVNWYRLPHETVDDIELTSLEQLNFGLSITANPTSIPTFDSTGYVRESTAITTNINAYTNIEGWKLISKPDWVDIDVWNETDNRVESQPWYGTETLSLRVIPNSNNTSIYRAENIILGDSSSNELATILVTQTGGEPNVIVRANTDNLGYPDFDISDTSGYVVINETVADIVFTTNGVALPEEFWWVVSVNSVSNTVYASTALEKITIASGSDGVPNNISDINIDHQVQGGETIIITLVQAQVLL